MRPTVASLSARSGQRAAKSSAILAFPAHGVSRRMRTTRLASALVQRRPGWLRGRLLRGTSPATPPSSKRRRHAQYVARETPNALHAAAAERSLRTISIPSRIRSRRSASGSSVSSTRGFRQNALSCANIRIVRSPMLLLNS